MGEGGKATKSIKKGLAVLKQADASLYCNVKSKETAAV